MTSILSKLWRVLSRPTRLVGRDLQGNKYYEYPNPNDSDRRQTKRMVVYREKDLKWDYVSGRQYLPVQWTAWLAHTRKHPPTIEELDADVRRQARVKQAAGELEAQYEQERAAQALVPELKNPPAQIGQSPGPAVAEPDQPSGSVNSAPAVVSQADYPAARAQSIKRQKETARPPPIGIPEQPESWQPRATRRGV